MLMLLLPGAGCAGHGSDRRETGALRVAERDFRISAPKRAPAGDVQISVHNKGPDDHEFILVRSDGARLPLRDDGVTVDEDRIEKSTLAAVEPAEPGSVNVLHVHLAPGRYELICNMAGHYKGGMDARLVVG
jgi:uncharacterized cupredoxin-like copper-binding protein